MGDTKGSHNVVVLAVEDNDAAYHLLEVAFREVNKHVELVRAVDGHQAIELLHRRSPYETAPRPDLILLNLNLPKMTGMEVLSVIKENVSLRTIPVVVFTSSDLDEDRANCLALGAKQFITKPLNYDDLVVAVKRVHALVPAF